MGIIDFVKGGVREMMIARPDTAKDLIVYKHPDQNVPAYSQLTVDSDECALFFNDGTYRGWLPPGRHTLQTQNIPFLNNIVNKFTGGDVFIAEIYFVKTQPVRGLPFGGPLESMEDPILFEFVQPRVFGEMSVLVVDPVRFVIGYYGQCGRNVDNDQVLNWIRGKFFMSVKTVIGQVCAKKQVSLLNLGGMSAELGAEMIRSAPTFEEIGIKIVDIGNFNINFSAEDQKLLREANKSRAEAKRGVGVTADVVRAKQMELDQKFTQDKRYVENLAGNYQNYAVGQALMGAGQGMAQGGDSAAVGGVAAQMAVGMAIAQSMHQPQQSAPVQQVAPAVAQGASGKIQCGQCRASVPPGKFCQECGQLLAASVKKFCSNCGTEVGSAKFCASCGTPAGASATSVG